MALATLLIKRLKRLIWPVGQLKLPEIAENRPRGPSLDLQKGLQRVIWRSVLPLKHDSNALIWPVGQLQLAEIVENRP